MRIEIASNDEFLIFINSQYAKIDDYSNKEQIADVVGKVLEKYKKKLKLGGFYKVKVFLNEKAGLFLEGVKLDSLDRSSSIDLRVVVFFDCDIYFKTDDYFVIRDVENVKFFDGYYYCLVKDISNINNVLEYGEFVYGDYVLDIIDKAILL